MPFIIVAQSKRYCKVQVLFHNRLLPPKPIPFTFATVIKGIAHSIFNCI